MSTTTQISKCWQDSEGLFILELCSISDSHRLTVARSTPLDGSKRSNGAAINTGDEAAIALFLAR